MSLVSKAGSSSSAPSVSSRISIEDFSDYTKRMHYKKKTENDDIFQDLEFQPLVIMEFSPDAKQAAQEWLMAKLQAPRIDLGAELLVYMDFREHSKRTVLYIGASLDRLLIGAEELKIPKIYRDGSLRELCLSDITQFENSDNLLDFLTSAEKQKVIFKGIENIRATDDDQCIPGYPKHTLYPGKSIIKKYLSRGIITNLFPLHEEEQLKLIARSWYTLKNYFRMQPIDMIQEYFGVKIGLYFSFLGLYTMSLIPPAIIGIVYFFFPWQSVYREASFALFNVIWSTVFLEGWKRYCNSLSFKWGTLEASTNYFTLEEPRADYYGVMKQNSVTGQMEPEYPKWKRVLKFYLVSIPIIAFCLTVAFLLMLAYFWGEFWMKKHVPHNSGLVNKVYSLIPAVLYAVCIGILNSIYRRIAIKLNKFENHRLPSSYENHLILKHVLFDFVNCFICLFYVAFYLQDRELLKTFLGTILITQQILGQINEAMVPFLFIRHRQKRVDEALKSQESSEETTIKKNINGPSGVPSRYRKQAALEGMMEKFTGSNDDYLELYIQFGYVFLFSSAFPLAALWALINNFIEIRTDAFKLCRVFQRPFAENANNIGAWQQAFEVVGIISVITNCALIGMDPEVQKLLPSSITPVNMVLIFVATEHIVLAIKASIAFLIPDIPKSVSLQMAKQEYAAKLALKRQMKEESNLNRKLKLVSRIRDAASKKRALIEAWKARPISENMM